MIVAARLERAWRVVRGYSNIRRSVSKREEPESPSEFVISWTRRDSEGIDQWRRRGRKASGEFNLVEAWLKFGARALAHISIWSS